MRRSLRTASGVVVLLLALVTASCGGGEGGEAAAEGPAWNHNPADAVLGPSAWGQIDASFERCASGERQSPVDIVGASRSDLPPLEFAYPATPFVVVNTGHTIEARMPEDSNLTLTIGDDVYRLVQFHFHAPSEHEVAGTSYPAEIHLVHESEAGEVAVVGILIEPSSLPAPLTDRVIETVGDVGEEAEVEDALSPLELLLDLEPPQASEDAYYTYEGSLTTPGCTEGIRWIVLEDIHIIDEATLNLLHEIIAGFPDYEGYADNNRPTQPLNGRAITRSGG
jgi:carbonic anhydrase